MKEKDKQIINNSALVLVDQIVSSLPGLNIAWGLSKALHGAGIELRKQRALEWVEMVRDNPNIFFKDLLESEDFQDAFVYSFEKYISERNSKKRELVKKIFLGYSNSEVRENFEIERMLNTLSVISFDGIKLLEILKKASNSFSIGSKQLSESLLKYLIKDSNDNPGKYKTLPGSNVRENWAEAETDLISIGILRTYNIPKYGGTQYHDYDFTTYGKNFIKYILD